MVPSFSNHRTDVSMHTAFVADKRYTYGGGDLKCVITDKGLANMLLLLPEPGNLNIGLKTEP